MEAHPTAAAQRSSDAVQGVTPLITMEYLAADQSLGTQWAHLEKKMVARLIMEHQVSFRSIQPLISGRPHLQRHLDNDLESTLKTDFCWSLNFSPSFIAQLVYEGFLPICSDLGGDSGLWVLMPKWHLERCIMRFSDIHVSKSARKRAKRFRLTADEAFETVVSRCIEQHGENWLYPPMRRAFCALHQWGKQRRPSDAAATQHGSTEMAPSVACPSTSTGKGSAVSAALTEEMLLDKVRFRSFELWEGDSLVAVNGAGTVQLLALAQLLAAAGFEFWDLGQELQYKLDLGARMVPRKEFLEDFRSARARDPGDIRSALGSDGTPLLSAPRVAL